MYLNLIIILLCCVLLWVHLKWKRVKIFWAERGVPHLPPHPIVGSLSFIQRENPALWIRRMYKQFKSPYIGIWVFWRPGVIINSPELARRVLVKDHEVFKDRFLSSGKSDPCGALNLFTVNDPIWSYMRRRLTPTFTAAKLRNLEGLIRERSQDLIQRIARDRKKPEMIDLRKLYIEYTTDVIGEAAFGIRSETLKTGDSVMRRITKDFMTFDWSRGLGWTSIFFFPELVDIFRFTFFPRKSLAKLREVFRAIIKQRGGYDAEVKESRDLLDALLKTRQDALADNEEMSEDLLLAQAAVFLFGGFDTTAITLSWATYELAWNPECQERLYRELIEAKENNGNKDLDSTQLSQLIYLNCVIHETLRRFPTMGFIDRIARKDYQLDDKVKIPAGTVIYVNAAGMQMDPEYFPEPHVFDPERFLPENEINIKPYTYLPFGEGPRTCIGKRFAYQSLRFSLSSLVLNYEFRVIPNSPKPVDVKAEKKGIFMGPEEKISVEFVPRNVV